MADYGHDLLFGTFITPSSTQADTVVALGKLSEQAGIDLVTFQDHPYQAGFFDTWTLMSYVAAATSRIRISANVLNLPLRPPAVLARAAASLDILSKGRIELGLGAGAFWDAIKAMGGRQLSPKEAVTALEEAIEIIHGIWDVSESGAVWVKGEFYQALGAKRGPAPAHDIGIWLGAYKPGMLRLTGRAADGWLPSLPYLKEGDLARGNRVIDDAALDAGRKPSDIRRLLNIGGRFGSSNGGFLNGPASQWIEELAGLAIEDGVSAFIAMGDDPAFIRQFGEEVAPAVRDLVAAERRRSLSAKIVDRPAVVETALVEVSTAPAAAGATGQYERLGVTPTPDNGVRFSRDRLWEKENRPSRPESGPEIRYTDKGRLVGKHLIDVHDELRKELTKIRDLIDQVRNGAIDAAGARTAIDEMTIRQNNWVMGAYCASYCRIVTGHHSLEDDAIFPHLRMQEKALEPIIDRLAEEHLVIHKVLDGLDKALIAYVEQPGDFTALQAAMDILTDTLLSHLAYEERELVEPLARYGFYTGQI